MPLRLFKCLLAPLALFLLLALVPQPARSEPRLPGVRALLQPTDAVSHKDTAALQRVAGEVLLQELRCAGCHNLGPGRPKAALPAPPLATVVPELATEYLRAFLANPAAARPGTKMPNVLAQLTPDERDTAVEELTHYLRSITPAPPAAPEWGDVQARDAGRALYASLGCIACHGPEAISSADENAFVSLAHLPRKTSVDALKRFLADPQSARPHTRMPNFRLTDDEQHALAMYLLRERFPPTSKGVKEQHQPGVHFEYFEGMVREGPPEWSEMKHIRSGTTATFELPADIRGTKLALRYSALIDVPVAGNYTFFTESNDGSELLINGRVVVNNHGFHGAFEAAGTVKLEPGLHQVSVAFWQDEGSKSLKVQWVGPGIKKAPIAASSLYLPGSIAMAPLPATLKIDPAKAAAGQRLFSQLRCQSCHEPAKASAIRQTLARARLESGCLASTVPPGAPDYALTQPQRTLLVGALTQAPPQDAASRALVDLTANNCLACHDRDGIGGPSAALNPLFTQSIEVDLGDEGRLPPSLTEAGAKLRPEAMLRILARGELHVRPYMATRMPSFPNELASTLTQLLSRADARPGPKPPKPNAKALEDGRRLLGTSSDMSRTGFGCINCHNVAGRAATGSPGPDLELATVRLNYAWFDRWLAEPQVMRTNTRMPAFFGDEPLFPNVAGGSNKRQRAAIWAYLSRGATPLPEGLVVQGKDAELVLGDEPIVFRTYMKGAGPRAIVVGNPELVHVAFDANVVRMATAWRGRFWDPTGTWTGRAGLFNEPLGDHVLQMPPGPSFATLSSNDAPWPKAVLDSRALGGEFLGYRLDAQRRPVFRYRFGGAEISEVARPKTSALGFSLMRSFTLSNVPAGLVFQAAWGKRIEKLSDERFVVDNNLELRLPPALRKYAFIRKQGASQQLLVRVPATISSFDVELRW